MIYKRSDLVRILNEAVLAVSRVKHVPMFECVYFTNNKIYAQNGKTFYQRDFPSDLDVMVPAYKFRSILLKMGEEVELHSKGRVLTIKSDNNVTNLRGLVKPKKYSIPKFEGDEFDFPEKLINAIECTLPSVSSDLTNTTMLGVHLKGGNAYSTDRVRATCSPVTDNTNFPNIPVTITREACLAIYQIGPPDKIMFNDKNVIFKYRKDGKIVVSSLVDMPFPEQAIKATTIEPKSVMKIDFPDSITLPIIRVSKTVSQDAPAIEVESKGNGVLFLSSESAPVGSSKEEVEIDCRDEFKFLIHPKHFQDILRFCKTLYFVEPSKPLLFKNEDIVCFMAPILPKEEE